MFQISVLGPVEVRRAGELMRVPGGKTSELLVRLALEAGTPVRADQLVEDVWAQDAVTTRRNTLQSKITRLRRAFGDPQVIVSRDGGYTLAVEPADIDWSILNTDPTSPYETPSAISRKAATTPGGDAWSWSRSDNPDGSSAVAIK